MCSGFIFHTGQYAIKDELELMMQRRTDRMPLAGEKINKEINPENILITPGAKPTIFFSMLIFGNNNSEIIFSFTHPRSPLFLEDFELRFEIWRS